MKIVLVQWDDAGLERHSMTKEEVKELTPMNRTNIGVLLHQDKEKIILVSGTVGDKGMTIYDQPLVIPTGIVKQMWRLKAR